jgi:formylglycine-generating enzyme
VTFARSAIAAAAVLLAGIALQTAQAQPASRIRLGAISIDQTEVNIADFRAFARATRLTTTAELTGGGFEFAGGWVRRPGWTYLAPTGQLAADNEPAVHVTWTEARDYCAHIGGRLPSLEEWRLAAFTEMRDQTTDRFVKGRTYTYPVGDQPDGMNTNRRRHVAVGSTKRGVNGLYDMGANVWEWLSTRQGDDAVTAGGSWWYGPEQATRDGVQLKSAKFFAVYIGFRCAYDVR